MNNNNGKNSPQPSEENTIKDTSKLPKENISSLTNKVKTMEDNNAEIRKNIDELYLSINQMSMNMEKMMNKFDSIAIEQLMKKEQPETQQHQKNIVARPLRTIMIGVLSGVYAITDKTTEVFSGVRENFEDVVAEAQYNNKKRRMNKTQEQF